MNTDTLATELLHEVKMSCRRWFIAFLTMVVIELGTVAGFLWYISLPTEDVSIENEDGIASYVGGNMNGDINNGESTCEKEGSEK